MNRITFRGVTAVLVTGGVVATAGAVAVPAIATASSRGEEPAKKQMATTQAWGAGRASAVDWRASSAAVFVKPKPKPRVVQHASRSTFRQSLSGSPREIAHAMVLNRGWSEEQWGCLNSLWERESSWDIYSENGSSGAYGIPQALPGSKMAEFGSDWRTNPVTQIKWGLSYISERYGTPCAAWDHSNAYNYY